jgi:hypothetical protein
MTMTIPTLPNMPAGYVAQAADMNDLSAACTFLLHKPIARVQDTLGGQSITTSAGTINFNTNPIDTDGMWASATPGRLTVQTPGYYKISYGVVVGTSTAVVNTYCLQTFGSNNPGGAGNTSGNYWEGYCVPFNTPTGIAAASGLWPFYLYAGDYIQIFAFASAGGDSTALAPHGSYFGAEYMST